MSTDYTPHQRHGRGCVKRVSQAGDRSVVHRIQPYGLAFFLECSKYTDFYYTIV